MKRLGKEGKRPVRKLILRHPNGEGKRQKAKGKKKKVRKLIFRNFQSPGDIVMLTAAVRDLHKCYPGRFVTDVLTPCLVRPGHRLCAWRGCSVGVLAGGFGWRPAASSAGRETIDIPRTPGGTPGQPAGEDACATNMSSGLTPRPRPVAQPSSAAGSGGVPPPVRLGEEPSASQEHRAGRPDNPQAGTPALRGHE